MADTTKDPVTDDVTTLAKVNDEPAAEDDVTDPAAEREDDVTVLGKMNDNPPREETDEPEEARPAMIR